MLKLIDERRRTGGRDQRRGALGWTCHLAVGPRAVEGVKVVKVVKVVKGINAAFRFRLSKVPTGRTVFKGVKEVEQK